MQKNITQNYLLRFFRKCSLFVLVAILSMNANSQTISTSTGTGYINNFSVNNPAAQLQTLVIENTNASIRVLTDVTMAVGPNASVPAGTAATVKLWYSATSLSGPPTVTTPTWTQIGTGSFTVPAVVTELTMISGLNFQIPATTQYRFAVEVTGGLRISLTPTPTPNIFSSGGVNLKVGDNLIAGLNIGYAGLSPTPNAANTPTFFGGSVTLVPFVACSGTPAPGNTITSASNVPPAMPFTLSLQNTTPGTNLIYQWQSAAALAGPYTAIAGANSATYTVPSMSTTTYYNCIVTCGASSATSTPVVVNSIPPYCASSASSALDEEILNVTFGSLNNTSTCATLAPGVGSILNRYSNYTGYAGAPVANVLRGLSTPLSVQVGTCGGNFTNSVAIWIDYNQDGTFAATERVYNSAAGTVGPHTETANILIPVTALAGTTRMRVISSETATSTGILACSPSVTWGEVEDYNVNIIVPTPCTGSPAPGNTISSASSVCAGAQAFTLSLQNNPPVSGLTYQWFSSPTVAGTYTAITGATNATLSVASVNTATCYYASVTCSGVTTNSTPVCVALNAATQCYCTSNATSVADEEILNVTVSTLNNTSTCTTLAPGAGSILNQYSNYTSGTGAPAAPSIIQGTNVPFTVQVGTCGGNFGNSTAIFIDLNANGNFTDAGERVYVSPASTTGPHIEAGNLVIPVTASLGVTRMRVITVETATPTGITPCGTYSWGETEDYNVNITPCIPLTVTSQPASASAVCGNSTTFTFSVTGTSPVYQWQYRTTATSPWLNVPNAAPYSGQTTNALNINPVTTGMSGYQYRVVFSGGCSAVDFSNVVTLTVNPITAVVTPASATICANTNTIVPISIGNFGLTQTSTFSSAANLALPISETGTGTTNVLPVVIPATAQITDLKVKLNITHTWVGDLIIALKAPNGQVYNLSYALDGTDNGPGAFTNTVLSFGPNGTGAPYPLLSTGTNPFTSTFRVDGRIAATATPLDNGVDNIARPTGPTGFTATTNIPATFFGGAGAGTGNWTIAMYDFYNDGANGGSINRLVNWSMDITYGALATGIFTSVPPTPNTIFTDALATVAYDGITPVNTVYVKPNASTVYNVAINTGTCSANASVPVTVNTAVVGTPTVANVSTCSGTNAVFMLAGVTGGTGLTYQWQVSTTTAPAFTNIAGATSATYTVIAPSTAMSGNKYRVIVTATGCTPPSISAAATLTVNTLPVVTISAAPITKLYPGLTTTLTAAVSSATASISYQWLRNGVPVTGATNNKLVVTIDGLGKYTLNVSDANGCKNADSTTTPQSITISDSSNFTRLFIYPSPNNGQFQVRYFNDITNGGVVPGVINVYDSKGSRVFSKNFTIGGGYQPMNVDLGASHGKGIYRVDLLTTAGERIKTGTVIVM